MLTLSLVPVLAVLAAASVGDRERCERYARRQIALIDANVERALQRRDKADRAFTDELRRFRGQYAGFARESA